MSVREEGYTTDRAEEIVAEVRETGQKGPLEWKVETADGDHRLLEVTATTAKIGGEQRHVPLMRDITERKRREREYEQIFNGVNDGIVIQDPETTEVLDVNRTYVKRLGYENGEEALEQGYRGLAAPVRTWSCCHSSRYDSANAETRSVAGGNPQDRTILLALLKPSNSDRFQRPC